MKPSTLTRWVLNAVCESARSQMIQKRCCRLQSVKVTNHAMRLLRKDQDP